MLGTSRVILNLQCYKSGLALFMELATTKPHLKRLLDFLSGTEGGSCPNNKKNRARRNAISI